MVKFKSYSGKFPNLCTGILILEIDGIELKFGDYWEERNDYNSFDSFWYSGGNTYFTNGWDSNVESGEWKFNVEDFPEKYIRYFDEVCELFNENVPWGCCGGCI